MTGSAKSIDIMLSLHITPVLHVKELHWIPVTYKALHGQSPGYIKDMLEVYQPARNLRSQNTTQLVVLKPRQ